MRTFELNKIVRRGVFEAMQEARQKVVISVLNARELRAALGRKVVEEATELSSGRSDSLTEAADTLGALKDYIDEHGHAWSEVVRLEKKRRAESGGFSDGVFVETVTLRDEDQWVEHYVAEPDRFREVTPASDVVDA